MTHMPMEPEAFAEQVAGLLRRMQPEYAIAMVNPRELLVNGRRLDLDNLYAAPQPQRTSIYGAPAPAANPALMGMGMPTQVSPMSAGQSPQMGGMMPPPMGFGQAPMGQQQPAMGFGQPAAPAQRMSFGQPAPMGQAQAPAAAGFGADPFGSNPFGGAPAPQPGAAPGSRANSVGGQPPPSNNPFASGSFI